MRRAAVTLTVATCIVAALAGRPPRTHAAAGIYEPDLDPAPGFNLVSWSGSSTDAQWEDAVQELYDLGIRNVAFVTYRYLDTATGNLSATSAYGLASAPEDAVLAAGMARAESLGMTAALNPFVEVDNNGGIGHIWRGSYEPGAATRAAFFASYQTYMEAMADLADANSVARLYVGSELKELSRKSTYLSDWTNVIDAADARFSGALSYAANHDNYQNVTFWDQLDEIGIDAYFSPLVALAATSGVGNPSIEEVKAAWASKLPAVESFSIARGKAVYFSEWGCVPEDTTLYQPWNWRPSDIDDPGEQLAGYQGLLEAADGMGDWLRGIDFWHWDMPGGGSSFAITPDSLPGQYLHDYMPKPGDANSDGVVDDVDLTAMATHWQQAGGWAAGDFTGDGFIDDLDLTVLATAWPGPGAPGAVPEPTMLALLVLGGLAAVCGRRNAGTVISG